MKRNIKAVISRDAEGFPTYATLKQGRRKLKIDFNKNAGFEINGDPELLDLFSLIYPAQEKTKLEVTTPTTFDAYIQAETTLPQFEASKPIATETSSEHLLAVKPATYDELMNAYIEIDTIIYYFEPTNAETYQLYLSMQPSGNAFLRQANLIYTSAAARVGATRYLEVASGGAVPVIARLPFGRIYYQLAWSGAPGATPGLIYVLGKVLVTV